MTQNAISREVPLVHFKLHRRRSSASAPEFLRAFRKPRKSVPERYPEAPRFLQRDESLP